MTSKQRRLVRKWKKENPKEAANLSREEIYRIISKEKGSEKKKNLYKGDKQSYNINSSSQKVFTVNDPEIPEGSRCWVCGKEVIESLNKTGVIAHIGGNRFYHKKGCGPNTRKWVLGHPTLLSLLVYIDSNSNIKGGGLEKLKEFKANFYPDQLMAWTADHIIQYLDWEEAGYPLPVYHKGRKSWIGPKIYDNDTDFEEVDDVEKFIEPKQKQKEEVIMSKKDKEEKKEKKNMGGLVPKEPTVVPKELYKHPQIGKLLKVLRDSDDDTDKRKARKALRDLGFKLSEEATWKPFLAGKLAKVEDEDEEDEEDTPKTKKGKKAEKEDKKGKKGKKFEEDEEEEESEEDDEEEEEKPAKKSSKKDKKASKKSKKDEDDEDEDEDD